MSGWRAQRHALLAVWVVATRWHPAASAPAGRPGCACGSAGSPPRARLALRAPDARPRGHLFLRGGCSGPVAGAAVTVYMEGTPEAPASDAGRDLVGILREHGIEFVARDVGADRLLRETVADRVDWKTFPQVHCNGRLLGDLDIVRELAAEGDLLSELRTFISMPPVDADPAPHAGIALCSRARAH